MTMTDARPHDAAADSAAWSNSATVATAPRGVRPPERQRAGTELEGEILATIGLTLFSIAVAAGYARVFAGWDYLDEFIVMAILGHGLGFGLRRVRVPGWLAFPAIAAALVWFVAFVYYRDSLTLLVPTGETLDTFNAEIELVREQFRQAVAPVNYGGGWDVLAAIGVALTILLSDTFAFRAFARAEALVPGGVLFVFVAALGTDRDRIALSALLVAAGVAATVALRAHHAPHRPTAIGRRRSPAQMVVPAAAATAIVVALAASLVGPRIPGADSDPVYETRGGNGGSITEVISPLVDIRSRLTNRSNSELFVVQADFASYWRSSALPRFDGTTWGLPSRALTRVDGQLSPERPGATKLIQQLRIVNLAGKFVPTAADPTGASPQDALRWNADSATLLKTDGDLQEGDEFTIESASPTFSSELLAAATATDAGDPIYLELPDNFPSSVGETARQVTAGATSPYESALTLQNWFRNEFDYSLEVQAGHGSNAIEGFLRDRVGYCEQFAGTYAAMMRTLGIPARVAVGFTPGVDTGAGFSVLGKNAHAWPEVWFDDIGWVPFEPTPGRGAPSAENYTNVPPEQDSSGADPSAPQAEQSPGPDADTQIAPPSTVTAPGASTPADNSLNIPDEDLTSPGTAAAATDDSSSSAPWRPLIVVAIGGLLLAAPAMLRRFRRSRVPADPKVAVAALWRRALDAVSEVGVRTNAAHTPTEHARATAAQFPVAARPVHSLADVVTNVSFNPDPPPLDERSGRGPSLVEECGQWCRQIERTVSDSISRSARVRRYFTRLR